MTLLTYDTVNGMEQPVLLGSDVSKSRDLHDVAAMVMDRLRMCNMHMNRSPAGVAYAIIMEANSGYFGIQAMVEQINQWAAKENTFENRRTFIYPYSRDNNKKLHRLGVYGTWTSNEEKHNQAHDMQILLSHGALSFAHQYIAGGPNDPEGPEREKLALMTELTNVREEMLWPKTPHGQTKRTITGKSGTQCDDRTMALFLAYTNSLRLRHGTESLRFREFLLNNGITMV